MLEQVVKYQNIYCKVKSGKELQSAGKVTNLKKNYNDFGFVLTKHQLYFKYLSNFRS